MNRTQHFRPGANVHPVADDGVDIVELKGQLNMACAGEVRTQLLKIIEQGSHKLVMDFGAVEFVDSSGLSVVISAYKQIASKAGKMVLSNLPKNVQGLFALTRMNEAFQVFADTGTAVDSLKSDV